MGISSTTSQTQETPEEIAANLQSVFFKIIQQSGTSTSPASFDAWYVSQSASSPQDLTAVNNALTEIFSPTAPQPPTYDDFINAITRSIGTSGASRVAQNFINGYRFILYTDNTDPQNINVNAPLGQDFNFLTTTISPDNLKTQFQTAFNAFASAFSSTLHPKDAPVITPTLDQTKQYFQTFFSRAVFLQNSTLASQTDQTVQYQNPLLVTSYESFYDQFYPNQGLTPAERHQTFLNLATTFVQQQINQNGYFLPTQSFAQWGTFLQQSAGQAVFTSTTSLASMGAEKTRILDNIFALLIEMTNVLQETAAVQSDRLTLYTQWQQAYTEQIGQIEVYVETGVATDPLPNRTTGEEGQTFRTDINALSASFKEQNSAERQVIADTAQSQQSAINQSTSAVTQQSNQAASILQLLSSLLESIYR